MGDNNSHVVLAEEASEHGGESSEDDEEVGEVQGAGSNPDADGEAAKTNEQDKEGPNQGNASLEREQRRKKLAAKLDKAKKSSEIHDGKAFITPNKFILIDFMIFSR